MAKLYKAASFVFRGLEQTKQRVRIRKGHAVVMMSRDQPPTVYEMPPGWYDIDVAMVKPGMEASTFPIVVSIIPVKHGFAVSAMRQDQINALVASAAAQSRVNLN